MKAHNSEGDDRRLSELLQGWQVKESLPPRFGERVWQRISRIETAEPASLWSQLAGWFDQVMMRPSLAVSYVTVLLAVGLAAGYWHARLDNAQMADQLGTRYVQMMDPYRMPR